MICPKCGAQIPDDSQFCGICGNNISSGSADSSPQQPAGEAAITGSTDNSEQQPGTNNYNNNDFAQNTASTGNYNNDFAQNTADANNYNYSNNSGLNTDNGQKKNGAAFAVLGIVAVAAIIVIVFLFSLFSGGGYKGRLKSAAKFVNKRGTDLKTISQLCYGDEIGKLLYDTVGTLADIDDDFEDWEDEISDEIEDAYDGLDDYLGDDWKISYEISKEKDLNSKKLEDYEDELEDYADMIDDLIDDLEDNDDYSNKEIKKMTNSLEKLQKKLEKSKITKGKTVKIKLTLEGEDETERDSEEVHMVKLNGDWVCWELISESLSLLDLYSYSFDY